MSANLLSLVQDALGGDFAKLAGQFVGQVVDRGGDEAGLVLQAGGNLFQHVFCPGNVLEPYQGLCKTDKTG